MLKKKILVVDDEQDLAQGLKIRLKANGYDVFLAVNSVQGFTMANKERPDLIILDIMLPGGGGFAVAERLKLSANTCEIPVIFLTGISGGEERACKAGAYAYLMKPYRPPVLLDEIKKALEISEGSLAE